MKSACITIICLAVFAFIAFAPGVPAAVAVIIGYLFAALIFSIK
jgi:hypothetical protein